MAEIYHSPVFLTDRPNCIFLSLLSTSSTRVLAAAAWFCLSESCMVISDVMDKRSGCHSFDIIIHIYLTLN